MRIVVRWVSLLAACFSSCAFAQTDLIVNGGFEVGINTEWHVSGLGVDVRNNSSFAHTGSGYLKMGEVPAGNTEFIYQTVTIPTNTIAAVLSYYRNLYAPSPDSAVFFAYIGYTNFTLATNIETLAVSATGNKGTAFYDLKTFDLTAFAGQTIDVVFEFDPDNLAYVALDDVSLQVETTADIAPNDYFTNRTVLTGNSASGSGKNTFATKEPNEPNHAGNAGGKSLWWRWTAPGDGVLQLSTQGSDFSTLLAVYTGSSVGSLTPVASDNALNEIDLVSRVKFPVHAGTEYEIAVDGFNSGAIISFGNVVLNLTFTADTTPPKVTISSPAANAKLTNSTVTVQGTASDNVAVARVEYRLENAAGTNSYQTADGTNHWSATVTDLIPGPNTIRVRAFDTATVSNVSPTVARTFNFVVVSPINLTISGNGTVSPNYANSLLEIGKTYTVTAKPAAGNVFSNWVGDIVSSNPKLTFVMQTNMTLQANFIPNPFLDVKGTYAGLFYGTNGVTPTNAGYFSARITDKGAFSAKVMWPAAAASVSGKLGVDGSFSNAIARPGGTPVQFLAQVDLTGGDRITGQFIDGNQTEDLVANRAVFSRTSPAPQAGRKYTLVIPGSDDSAAAPGGFGYGTASVDASANITFAGVLGDGAKMSQKTFMAKDGSWPLFASPYGKKGLIIGWLEFDINTPDSPPAGNVSWMKSAVAGAKFYPLGFDFENLATASSLYPMSAPLFTWSDGQVVLQGANLSQAVTNTFTIGANNKVTGSNGTKLTFTTSSGTYKGSVISPDTGKPIPISGAILQNQDAGFGVFPDTNQTGSVLLLSQ